MPITLEELKEKMKRWDELDILDTLDITSEELVEVFSNEIEEKYDQLIEQEQDEPQGDDEIEHCIEEWDEEVRL
jgi:hypothetical protein